MDAPPPRVAPPEEKLPPGEKLPEELPEKVLLDTDPAELPKEDELDVAARRELVAAEEDVEELLGVAVDVLLCEEVVAERVEPEAEEERVFPCVEEALLGTE